MRSALLENLDQNTNSKTREIIQQNVLPALRTKRREIREIGSSISPCFSDRCKNSN